MRIARLIARLNVGGPAKHVAWLTVGLDSAGFETVLITGTVPDTEDDMTYFARNAGIEPVVLESMSRELSLRDVFVVFQLVGLFRKQSPHIIHTHTSKAGAVGRVAAWIYRWLTPGTLLLRPRQCRVVHTYHGHVLHSYFGPFKTRLFIAIERLLARCTDRIVVISEQQRQELSEHFRIGRREQYQVVPLGLDLEEGQASSGELRRELGLRPSDLLVGIVGRLSHVKNHDMLLKAAAQLVEKAPTLAQRLHFVIIGDGELRAELESRAEELDLSTRVTFAGFRSDVVSLYTEFDLIALTSLNEGTPLTLIEAMRAGCPVVSTEVGGVVDILGSRAPSESGSAFTLWDHGATSPTRDTRAFTKALRYLLEQPDLRQDMGARARSFVQTRFSKERMTQELETLYRALNR